MVLPFPLLGENHPVRRQSMNVFVGAALISMSVHLLVAQGRLLLIGVGENAVELRKPISSGGGCPDPIIITWWDEPDLPVPRPIPPPIIVPSVFSWPEPVPWDPDDSFVSEEPTVTGTATTDLATGPPSPPAAGSSHAGDSAPQNYVPVADEPPVLISISKPDYPDLAKAMGIEGIVLLDLLVGEDGRVKGVKVVQGIELLDEAAVAAAQGAVFKPAVHRGRPVATRVRLPLRFVLD